MPLPEFNISKEQLTPKRGTIPVPNKEDILPKRPEGLNISKDQEKINRQGKLVSVDKDQLQKLREDKLAKRKQLRAEIEAKKQIAAAAIEQTSSTPEEQETKLSQVTVDKVRNLASIALPIIIEAGKQAGLDYAQQTLQDTCPPQPVLQKLKQVRDNVGQQLNGVSIVLDTTKQLLDTLQQVVDGQIEAIKGVVASQAILSAASKVIPSPPGVPGLIVSTISDLQTLKDELTFDPTGNPKVEQAKQKLSLGLGFFGQAAGIVSLLVNYLTLIDELLTRCGEAPNPLNQAVKNIAASADRGGALQAPFENYKGFVLTIEERQYSPTVKQTRGVALNSQGIPLLTTDYSFTTIPQLLINQLKFTIDSQNLKPF